MVCGVGWDGMWGGDVVWGGVWDGCMVVSVCGGDVEWDVGGGMVRWGVGGGMCVTQCGVL